MFTPQFGRINTIIRGVRTKSKLSAQKQAWLQPFQALQIEWRASTADHLDGLIRLQTFEPYPSGSVALMGESAFCGLYLNELLYRLLSPMMAVESLFVGYQQTLSGLSQTQTRQQQAWLLRQFELHLLSVLGYEPNLTTCSNGFAIEPNRRYIYDSESGFRLALDSEPEGISGYCLHQMATRTYCPTCLTAWKRLTRLFLQNLLGGKPLLTRQLFQSN
jgi:DNA repair protein RecO (recombination protein O)